MSGEKNMIDWAYVQRAKFDKMTRGVVKKNVLTDLLSEYLDELIQLKEKYSRLLERNEELELLNEAYEKTKISIEK